MSTSRKVVWFSCGKASAVAAYLAVRQYESVDVVHCDTLASEHSDNARFFCDVQKWIGVPIQRIISSKYKDIDQVFEATRYLSGNLGARCTVELKKVPRFNYQRPDDTHIFGYTLDEYNRIARFKQDNPELLCDWILQRNSITKSTCSRILEKAGIREPAIYSMGFENANCLGCVKASSPHYWAKVRRLFPDVFERRADQSKRFGASLVRINEKRAQLTELPPDDDYEFWNKTKPRHEDLSCGPQCSSKGGR